MLDKKIINDNNEMRKKKNFLNQKRAKLKNF